MQAALQATQTYLAALASGLSAWSAAAAQAATARDDRIQAAQRTYAQRLQDVQSQAADAWQHYESALLDAGCVASGDNPVPLDFVQHSLQNGPAVQTALAIEADAKGITLTQLLAEKAIERAAAKQAANIAAKRAAAKTVEVETHHLLPKEFADYFRRVGLNIERYTIQLEKGAHRLKPGGLHTGKAANSWNGKWDEFLKEHEYYPSKDEILEHLTKMIKDFGLE